VITTTTPNCSSKQLFNRGNCNSTLLRKTIQAQVGKKYSTVTSKALEPTI
jgi:hypothetical protein